MAPFDKP